MHEDTCRDRRKHDDPGADSKGHIPRRDGLHPACIADETVGTTEEEILPFLKEKNHPALSMEPLITG
jgi:hypothetical protein